MKKVVFLLVTLFFSLGVALAQNDKKGNGAVISADKTEFDFGTIKEVNGPVSHVFVIKNVAVLNPSFRPSLSLRARSLRSRLPTTLPVVPVSS